MGEFCAHGRGFYVFSQSETQKLKPTEQVQCARRENTDSLAAECRERSVTRGHARGRSSRQGAAACRGLARAGAEGSNLGTHKKLI